MKYVMQLRQDDVDIYSRADERIDYMPPFLSSIEFYHNGLTITFEDGTERKYSG